MSAARRPSAHLAELHHVRLERFRAMYHREVAVAAALDFCAEHGITADIEMIKIQQINEAYQRLLKSDVKYRFVIEMASLKA